MKYVQTDMLTDITWCQSVTWCHTNKRKHIICLNWCRWQKENVRCHSAAAGLHRSRRWADTPGTPAITAIGPWPSCYVFNQVFAWLPLIWSDCPPISRLEKSSQPHGFFCLLFFFCTSITFFTSRRIAFTINFKGREDLDGDNSIGHHTFVLQARGEVSFMRRRGATEKSN